MSFMIRELGPPDDAQRTMDLDHNRALLTNGHDLGLVSESFAGKRHRRSYRCSQPRASPTPSPHISTTELTVHIHGSYGPSQDFVPPVIRGEHPRNQRRPLFLSA
ncbi:hypothetical protein OF83DRAFT_1110439 [Amylostereum chailletii]|nr:hypothetical protein OF83DRAFT_1110439 [Amylostereum chailletii]